MSETNKSNTQTTNHTLSNNQLTVFIDTKEYTTKPLGTDTKRISTTILKNKRTLSIKDFAEEISLRGKTSMISLLKNKNSLKNPLVEQQSLLMIDIDNENEEFETFTIEQAKTNPFILNHALFIYETFSSNIELPKFRIVFLLDKPLTDKRAVIETYKQLLALFPQADNKIVNPNRLFFGSTTGYTKINFNNRLSLDNISKTLEQNIKDIIQGSRTGVLSLRNSSQPESTEYLDRMYREYEKQTIRQLNKNLPDMDFVNCVKELNNIYFEEESLRDKELLTKRQLKKLERHQKITNRVKEMFTDPQLRTALGLTGQVFPDYWEVSKFVVKLDMRLILGNRVINSPFHDIFSEDNTPSADIGLTNEQTYFYFRHNGNQGEQMVGDIVQLLQKLAPRKFYNRMLAIEFLIEVLDLNVTQTSLLGQKRRNIKRFISDIEHDLLKKRYPDVYKRIKKDQWEIVIMLNIFSNYVYFNEHGQTDMYMFVSTETMMKKVQNVQKIIYCETEESANHFHFITHNRTTIILNLLMVLEIIEKLKDKEIDIKLKKELKEYRERHPNEIKNYPNVYTGYNQGVTTYLQNIELNATKLLKRGISNSQLSFRTILSVFDVEKAHKSFEKTIEKRKKTKPHTISKKDENLTKREVAFSELVETILRLELEDSKYITYTQLYKIISTNLGISENASKKNFYPIRDEILNSQRLIEIKITPMVRRRLNIPDEVKQRKVIVKKSTRRKHKLY